jgi:zinc protease
MQTNAGIAALLITIAEFGLGLDYVERYPALLNEVSRDNMQSALQRYLDPDALIIAVAGPG